MAARRRRRQAISGRQAPFDMVCTVVKYIIVIVLILFFVTKGREAYNLGYSIFSESSKDPVGQGTQAAVTTTSDMSEKAIAKLLQKDGIIESAFVFQIQLKFSDYEGKLQPGTYTLSSEMLPSEIMEEMASGDSSTGTSAASSSSESSSDSSSGSTASSEQTGESSAGTADDGTEQ